MCQNHYKGGIMLRVFAVMGIVLCCGMASAQTPTVETPKDTLLAPAMEKGEMVLDEIEIHGQIEKPGVIVMPRRVNPEIEQLEMGRSFENEVKEEDASLPKTGEALGQVDDVKSIKKAVERKRN
jgi:hypothetical protein